MTDFVDDDLVRRQPPPRTDVRMAPPGTSVSQPQHPGVAPAPAPIPVRAEPQPQPQPQAQAPAPTPAPVQTLPPAPVPVQPAHAPVAPMPAARPSDQVEDQMASAMKELERLRQKQENLQTQKSDLEDMRRKQKEFEVGKKEMIDCLSQSLISLEKEELKIEELVNVLGSTRLQFKTQLEEIEDARENKWEEDRYREELNKALALIENARNDFNKAQTKIASLQNRSSEDGNGGSSLMMAPARIGRGEGFMHWFKIGFAVSLPLIITFIILGLIYMKGLY